MVAAANLILLLQGTVAILFCSLAFASDPSPLQDFCVTHPNAPVAVNGWPCKDPKQVLAEDFFFSGLNLVGNTSNPYGSKVTLVNVDLLPGLNTLGVSLARVDYVPRGLNPLHLHPRATEVFTVLEGTLEVGFVTSNPDYRFIGKVLHKGDVFVFPQGLIHYQRNVGYGNAVAVSALSSQNPGIVRVAESVFGSSPHVSLDILSKSFQVYKQVIERIQSKF